MGSELAASGPANNTAAAVTVSCSYSHLASGFHSGHRTPVFGEVFSLLKLTSAEVAAKDRSTVLVNAISEVLAGHADAFALPALKLAFVDEIPFLHVPAK